MFCARQFVSTANVMKLLSTVDLYTAKDGKERVTRVRAVGPCLLERFSCRKC
jgi:hypothetical protein